jgi:heparin binding hemagglutinin HbhA
MSRITEIRKSVAESTPLLVVVGATDVVVERARAAAADAQKVQAAVEDALNTYQVELRKGLAAAQTELGKTIQAYQVGLEPARIQAKLQGAVQQVPTAVQQAPALAVSRALEVAGQVETGYSELAERGKHLVERVRRQKPTQDLIAQGRVTVNQARAAVTTARKAVDDTTAAARSAVTIGRREAGETVAEVEKSVAQT